MRNVILISIDSMRYDSLEFEASLPTLSFLAEKGAFFTTTIVQAPFTAPSHASMLTGLYPFHHGIRDQKGVLNQNTKTIFTYAHQRGFKTAAFTGAPILSNRGFEKDIDIYDQLNLSYVKKAINILKSHRFCIFLHFWDVHTPYCTNLPIRKHQDFWANFFRITGIEKKIPRLHKFFWNYRVERIRDMVKGDYPKIFDAVTKGYEGALKKIDLFIKKLIQILAVESVLKDTLIIIASDHGDSFNEHGEIYNQIERRYEHGHFLYDNIIKTFTIFYNESYIKPHTIEQQVRTIDILPTILEMLSIRPTTIDGSSLSDLLTSCHPRTFLKYAYSEIFRNDQVEPEHKRSLRSSAFKLIIDYRNNIHEFYHLKEDPQEIENIYYNKNFRDQMLIFQSELKYFLSKDNSLVNGLRKEDDKNVKLIELRLKELGYL